MLGLQSIPSLPCYFSSSPFIISSYGTTTITIQAWTWFIVSQRFGWFCMIWKWCSWIVSSLFSPQARGPSPYLRNLRDSKCLTARVVRQEPFGLCLWCKSANILSTVVLWWEKSLDYAHSTLEFSPCSFTTGEWVLTQFSRFSWSSITYSTCKDS